MDIGQQFSTYEKMIAVNLFTLYLHCMLFDEIHVVVGITESK